MKRCAAFVLMSLLLAGCNFREQQIMSGREDDGLVIVLTGVEGRSPFNAEICEGLSHGHVTAAVDLYDWTAPLLTPLYNQRAYARNHRKAVDVAARVVQYRMEHPNRPVILIGQSGGGAIAIWAVEALPPGVSVDGVILLAASLSPDYMLDTALSKTRRGIVNFYSSRDWVLLGLGTTLAGTMDGEFTSSAGKTGFEVPVVMGHLNNVYKRLYQIPWQKDMAGSGSTGSHLSSGAPKFVATYVAPLIRLPRWSDSIIARVLKHESVDSILASLRVPAAPPAPPPDKLRRPAVEGS